jgi:hypothetical protein
MSASEATRCLAERLRENGALWECLGRVAALNLPSWYLAAGCIAQTVWNSAHAKAPGSDIVDYDLVYYDSVDLSEESETAVEREAKLLVADLPVKLDVKNQARVHLWYPKCFGYAIQPYLSTEDAIGTWPTTATAVGVRPGGRELQVVAPFGLDDLFNLVVRANRVQITPEIYEQKVVRWIARWPSLTVLPWRDGVGSPGARRFDLERR